MQLKKILLTSVTRPFSGPGERELVGAELFGTNADDVETVPKDLIALDISQ